MAGWGFMTKRTIVLSDDVTAPYIGRRHVFQTPWFGIYKHRLDREDTDRYLHDHPWGFWSFILKGGYDEFFCRDGVEAKVRTHKRWSLHHIPHGSYHAITRLHEKPTITLIFRGRRKSDWGYLTPEGWVSRKVLHAEWYPDGSDVLEKHS